MVITLETHEYKDTVTFFVAVKTGKTTTVNSFDTLPEALDHLRSRAVHGLRELLVKRASDRLS